MNTAENENIVTGKVENLVINVDGRENTPLLKEPYSINEEKKEVVLSEKESKRRSAGMLGSIFNMANTVIGAGVLAFPFTFMDSGLLVVILSGLSMHVVVYCGMVDDRAQSYQDVIRLNLGQFALTVSEILFIMNLVGALVCFLVIIADCIEPVVLHFLGDESYFSQRVFIICFMGCAVCFPLTLLKEVKKLSFSSFIALGGVLYLMCMIIVLSIVKWTGGEPLGEGAAEIMVFNRGTYLGIPKTLISIPIITLAFQGIEIIAIPIYYELKDPKLWKMDVIIFSALIISSSIYTVVGCFGFLTFGENVNSNILLSYGGDSIPALIARFLIGLTVTLSYPLIFFAMRLAVHSFVISFEEVVVDRIKNRGKNAFVETDEEVIKVQKALELKKKREKRENISTLEFLVVTVIGNLVGIIISIFTPNISDVFGIVGSFGSVTFVFIYPCLLTIMIIKKSKYNLVVKIILYIVTAICIIIAFAILVLGETVTILKMVVEARGGNP